MTRPATKSTPSVTAASPIEVMVTMPLPVTGNGGIGLGGPGLGGFGVGGSGVGGTGVGCTGPATTTVAEQFGVQSGSAAPDGGVTVAVFVRSPVVPAGTVPVIV
ncbi:hypothetical protein [Micromonospora chalcea]|uniref:hypothetical protein n=1 Tax=Micromonospora chalcea TaxID=1874 RepID=UPI003817C1CB